MNTLLADPNLFQEINISRYKNMNYTFADHSFFQTSQSYKTRNVISNTNVVKAKTKLQARFTVVK